MTIRSTRAVVPVVRPVRPPRPKAGARRTSPPTAVEVARPAARPAVGLPTAHVADARAVPHVAARSVLAGGPAQIPSVEALQPVRPPRRVRLRRRLVALLAATLIVGAAAVAFTGTRVVLARFTDAAVIGSSFSTGTWAVATTWYLHNDPTPPTGGTVATFNLPLDATAPTASILRNYDTNCDARVGRSIVRGSGLVTESTTCRFATWRSAALADARTLDGTATLRVWARKSTSGGTNPTLRAHLRVFDPGTSTWTELGSADDVVSANANQAWASCDFSWALSGVDVAAGRRIEVKLVATGGDRNLEVAYDTTGQPASLTLP